MAVDYGSAGYLQQAAAQNQQAQQQLAQLQDFNKSAQAPTDFLTAAEGKYGVGESRNRLMGLRGAITNTEQLLGQVDPSVTGRTSRSLVTEAQRNRIVQNERAPIADQFNKQQGAYQNETGNLADLTNQSSREAQMGIAGQTEKQSALQNLYNTLYGQYKDTLGQGNSLRQLEIQQQNWLDEQAAADRRAAEEAARQRAYMAALQQQYNQPQGGGGGNPAAFDVNKAAGNASVGSSSGSFNAYNPVSATASALGKVPGAIGRYVMNPAPRIIAGAKGLAGALGRLF